MLGPLEKTLIFAYAAILIPLGIMGLHRLWLLLAALRARREESAALRSAAGSDSAPPAAVAGPLPFVTVQLPVFNERYVAARLLQAAAALEYPADRLEIQVLDDSEDDTSRILAEAIADLPPGGPRVEQIRRGDRRGFKAGALQAGLDRASGDLIAIFDADFLPEPDWLRRIVGDFAADPKLGMVQTRWRHLNASAGFLTRIQAILLDAHFGVEHYARSRRGCYFNFNGTAGIWRRRAIEDVGGWSSETLTEDLHLSYRAQLAGWRFAYRDDIGVLSELPVEMSAFRTQQHRWSKGGTQVLRRLGPRLLLHKASRARQKFEAIAHLGANFSYVLMFLLSLLMPLMIVLRERYGVRWLAGVDGAVLLCGTLSVGAFYYHSQRRAGEGRLASLLMIPVVMAFGIGMCVGNALAVVEGLLGIDSPFRRTAKYGDAASQLAGEPTSKFRAPAWSLKSYVTLRWGLPLTELLLAIVSLGAAVYAVRVGSWQSFPFVALFAGGYALTAGLSIRQGWAVSRARAARRVSVRAWENAGDLA